jgi:hypothetical protein
MMMKSLAMCRLSVFCFVIYTATAAESLCQTQVLESTVEIKFRVGRQIQDQVLESNFGMRKPAASLSGSIIGEPRLHFQVTSLAPGTNLKPGPAEGILAVVTGKYRLGVVQNQEGGSRIQVTRRLDKVTWTLMMIPPTYRGTRALDGLWHIDPVVGHEAPG